MPIHEGKDDKGTFYQWGQRGKKYYYKSFSDRSKKIAYNRALRQARAAYAHGYRGK
jgi:hypothetical protein